MRRNRNEPRPTCPECGRVVIPTKAKCITADGSRLKPNKPVRSVIEGVYCCAECAMDAWVRGFPMDRSQL